KKVFSDVLSGINAALDAVGGRLIGGETAELPGMLASRDLFELAGFAVGTVPKSLRHLGPKAVREGDILVGLPSSGPHANGFSLIRKALTPKEIAGSVKEILAPTALYHPQLKILFRDAVCARGVHAMAHITGGGFQEKLPRALGADFAAVVHVGSWPVPEVFSLIQQRARLDFQQMTGVLNMGIGFVLAVDPKVCRRLCHAIPGPVYLIGSVARRGKWPGLAGVALI
ncbi:MAG: AIR synthase-related protein, partial [Elusimicrobiota bacterium]